MKGWGVGGLTPASQENICFPCFLWFFKPGTLQNSNFRLGDSVALIGSSGDRYGDQPFVWEFLGKWQSLAGDNSENLVFFHVPPMIFGQNQSHRKKKYWAWCGGDLVLCKAESIACNLLPAFIHFKRKRYLNKDVHMFNLTNPLCPKCQHGPN